MDKEIDLKIQSGPCIGCGETDYPLSMGGPDICPACDCGRDLKIRLAPYREKVKQLQAKNERLKQLLKIAICPNVMNGCQDGKMPNPIGEIEQCQWCYEKEQILRTVS